MNIRKLMLFLVLLILFFLIDIYVYQAVLSFSKHWNPVPKNIVRFGYWGFSVLTWIGLTWFFYGDPYRYATQFRSLVMVVVFMNYFSKLFAVLILFIDDAQRAIRWAMRWINKGASGDLPGETISRSDFLVKTAMIAAAVPFTGMAYGIISGAHDYRIRRKTIFLPNLPSSFDGITIGQVSDIHSGSFFNKKAVKGGVEMLLEQRPDMIFFTGDLVNNETAEVKEYTDIFNKFKAPLGVYSVTGNHDYGDYKSWSSQQAKRNNFSDLIAVHKQMGFDILMNENRHITVDGEKLAVLGVENWGTGRFPKYGKLEQAYAGTSEVPVKILLSHDPSHWDAQVRKDYPDIDIMLAGHTHGFQFGVELGDFKWSPSQYAYKQWAGLYQQDQQYLYVNRGFGFIGYPGRIGMPPELTILTLKKGNT